MFDSTATSLLPTPAVSPVMVPRLDRSMGLDTRYSGVTKIGAGGNAEVYQCLDQQTGQTLALKRLRVKKSNRKSDWQRFVSEPCLMKRISHPIIPTIHDIFPERMYKPYFTMEWIDGMDLCRILSGLRSETAEIQERFPLDRLVEILIDVCEGLSAAHEQGIVHRDVKPENIMLTEKGDTKLVDWGIALSVDSAERSHAAVVAGTRQPSQERRKTRAEQRIGSPLYMSPEQVRRDADIDGRTDVYSLGVILYDCLSLTTMIRSTTTSGIFAEILGGDSTPPSRRSLRRSVPSSIEAVCMKAVSKDRNDRYDDTKSMGKALQACIR